MKFYYKLFFLVGSWLLSLQLTAQTPPEQQVQSFTLDQCIEYAIAHNPNLKSANLGGNAADAKVRETLATGLPQIGATADLGNNFIVPTPFLPPGSFGSDPAAGPVKLAFGTPYV